MTHSLDEIPAFLRGPRPGPKPRRAVAWRNPRVPPPEGEKWADAERWEVNVDFHVAPTLASGTRLLYVLSRPKWTELRDAEAYARIATADWNRMSKNGRRII